MMKNSYLNIHSTSVEEEKFFAKLCKYLIIYICVCLSNLTSFAEVTWRDIFPKDPQYSAIEKMEVDKAVKSFMTSLSEACPIEIIPNELTLEAVERNRLMYQFKYQYFNKLPEIIAVTDLIEYITSAISTEDLKDIYLCMLNALYSYYDIKIDFVDTKQIPASLILKQDGSIKNLSISDLHDVVVVTETTTTIEIVDDNESNSDNEETIYSAVEEPAVFPGGIEGLKNWLSKNIIYPEDALENEIKGRVIVRFVINQDGSVSDPKIEKGVHKSLDDEAIRLVKSMPKWTPGRNNGKAVRSYFNLPINYNFETTK